jgi:serine/threonine protein kinase
VIKCPNCSVENLDGSAYCDSCGDPLGAGASVSTPPIASASSRRVIAGRYRIERELGGGGQKLMYLAADQRLSNRLCALAELTPSARSLQAIAEGKLMFGREAESLAKLGNIHIVQVYDYFDEADRCYLVEEYVPGQTLQQRIASRGRLGVGEMVEIALQVLDALEYLHGQTPPLVHRDLKPDNIMLAPQTSGAEVVKLIDFGIARHFQVQRGTVHGTPGYAAPEQYRGMSEPRTDLYALGGVLHYALSGRDPQEHEPFSFPPLASLRADLPNPLCMLIDQALSSEADRRPSTAAQFKARLIAATSAKPVAAHAPQSRASVPRTHRAPAPHVPPPPRPHSAPPPPPLAPTVPLPASAPQPEVVEAADNQDVLAVVRSLFMAALAVAGGLALSGEVLLAGRGITISRILLGVALAKIREAANLISTLGLVALLIALVASRRRGRAVTLIVGLIAISALHAAVAALLIDYLLFPALVVAVAIGSGLMLRRACVRLLSRRGLGLAARARAFFLLIAPPAAVCAAALLIAAASPPAPSMSTYRWPPPYAPATIAPKPAARRPAIRYRAAARPRRTARAPEFIEADLRQSLSDNGFPNVGVSVDSAGRAYISGSASDFTQKEEIENLARGVAGVRSLVSTVEVPRGWMGLTVKSGGGGALVSYLAPRGPAAGAGIMRDDVIVAIDSRPVGNHADFRDAIAAKAAGQTVTVTLVRNGQTIDVAVKLGTKPSRSG